MKSGLVTAALATAMAAAAGELCAAGGKLDGSYLHNVTMKVETAHLDWAKPLAGGPVKALLLSPRNLAAREIVELAQRLDLDFEAFLSFRACAPIAMDDIYEGAVTGTSTAEKEAEILRKVEGKYDVIVLGNCDLNMLPPEAKYRILVQVAEGAGLVIVHAGQIPYKKLFAQPMKDAPSSILEMANQEGLPEKARAVPADKLLQCFQFGKGRIARIDYQTAHGAHWGGLSLSPLGPFNEYWMSRYENCMAFVARSVLWASGRETAMQIVKGPSDSSKELDAADLANTEQAFKIKGADGADGKLLLRIRDEWNTVEGSWELPVEFEGEAASVGFTPPFLKAGTHFLDARLLSGNGVEDFGYRVVKVASPVGSFTLSPAKESFEKGEKVGAKIILEKPLPKDAKIAVSLADSPYKRVWAKREIVLKGGQSEAAVELDVPPLPTIAGYLQAEISSDDKILAKATALLFFPERSIGLFPTIGWDSISEILSPMVASRIVEDLGWRQGLSHPSPGAGNARAAAVFDQRFVPYMTRIMLSAYPDKPNWTKGAWFFPIQEKKQEIEALAGDESIYNPAAQAIGKACFMQRLDKLPPLGPAIYSLGDENFFSYDIGYSPSEEKEYRRFLEKRYGKIEILNRERGTNFPSFSEVQHQTEKEMKEAGRYAAWFDHGAFVEKEYADTHHLLSKWIKEADPHALVGAEGSVPGDLEVTIDGLEFWGPYSDPVMDEVLRSIGGDRVRTLWWGGYVGSHGGRSGYPIPLWGPLLAGTVNGSSWFSTGVSAEGLLAADLSYPSFVEELKPRLMRLQNGLAQLLIATPMKKDGVGIRWCHMSSRAPLLDQRFVSPLDSAGCIKDFCYHNGIAFDFVTPSGIKAGALKDLKIFFLCGASVIDDGEAEALRSFVKDGGILVADINPGILNGFGRPVEKAQLADILPTEPLSKKVKPELKPFAVSGKIRDVELKLAADKAFTSAESPVFQLKQSGSGIACLLNFAMSSARGTASPETPFDKFLGGLLAAAGVNIHIAVEGLNNDRLMVRLREAPDGVVLGLMTDVKDVGKEFKISLPREYAAYRADGGYLSTGSAITDTLDEPFKLYFLSEKKMDAPKLALSASKVGLGGELALDLSCLVQGGIYRLEIMRPDGRPDRLATKVLALDGKKKTEPVRFAFNAEAGTYTLKLTDVRTGLSSEEDVKVGSKRGWSLF